MNEDFGMERRCGTLDIDRLLEIKISEVRSVVVHPLPLYSNRCPDDHKYSPSFPFFLNGNFLGFPCGNCITDFLEFIRRVDPTVEIHDRRKVLYN